MRLINADKVKAESREHCKTCILNGTKHCDKTCVINLICDRLDLQPTVEPENTRPQDEWLHRRIITKDRSFDMVVCSNCQTEFSWDAETGVSMDNYKTCPNCGAKMKKGGAE